MSKSDLPRDISEKKVFIVAAEDSSALYAQRLLENLKKRKVKYKAFGVGNSEMESLGFECLARTAEMAAVGFQEVLPKLKFFKQKFEELIEACEERQPDIVLLLDYPGFNLRLAKALKERGFRVLYYISPQVWAWKKGRIKTIKRYVDRMLVILPFEKEFYERHGVDCDFVGHPLLDELSPQLDEPSFREDLRNRFGFLKEDHVLGLMPGSRETEIRHHLDVHIRTAQLLAAEVPNLKVALLVAPGLDVQPMKERMGVLRFPITVIKRDPFEMALLSDTILCASGTATLTVGLMKTPLVIMYRTNFLSAIIVRTIIRMKYYGIINLIMDRFIAPEIFQEFATPKRLSKALKELMSGEKRERAKKDLSELRSKFGEKGATERVTDILIEELDRANKGGKS